MRNDPFAASPAALRRPSGHHSAQSKAKWDILTQPIAATGVPLGGIGTGGILRSSDGRFSRWTIKAGGLRSFDLPANGFALRVRPEGETPRAVAFQPRPASGELDSFDYETESPEWAGLFPLAWHRHRPVAGVEAHCLSFSPVIPGDPDSASLPVALFRWRLTNTSNRTAETSLLFHFANMNGMFAEFGDGKPDRVAAGCFNRPMDLDTGTGVILDRRRTGPEPKEGDGEWAIAASGPTDATFSRSVCFDGSGDGDDLWREFVETGDAPDTGPGWLTEAGFREVSPSLPAAAVCAKVELAPDTSCEIVFSLVWDLPMITFGQGRKWHRAYTDRWGREGKASTGLTKHAHRNWADWEGRIRRYQADICERFGAEPHRAGMALNELYFLVDGLTVHTSARGSPDGRRHFGLIECIDYALYNTLDLWVYAADAVGQFAPDLSASVAADYAEQLVAEDSVLRRHRWGDALFPSNPAGACPHDLGGPAEDPFVVPNSYTYRDSTNWKDLNCDLVLCIWREGQRMGAAWRSALFPHVRTAIDHLQQYDRDGDGLIENDGIPDQTFDNIPMKGPSSYCGGLWIATLRAGAAMASEAGKSSIAEKWNRQADRATVAFEDLLFAGSWYRVDTKGPLSQACFVEQLFGPFVARRFGLGDIVDPERARAALRSVYQHNFLEAGNSQGAVSLSMIPDGAADLLPHSDDTSFQTAEIQPGFNFSLAAQLEAWGLREEADTLRRALYRELYEKRNLAFQTPAAINVSADTCRAVMNMRPLAVWWMG